VPPTRSVGSSNRSAGLLVGRTHLSGTVVSLVGGDLGVPMSHRNDLGFQSAGFDLFIPAAQGLGDRATSKATPGQLGTCAG
jgi:hypothetical protein